MFKKILAVIFILGFLVAGVGFVLVKGDFSMISKAVNIDSEYEYKEYTSEEEFSMIFADLSSHNIVFHKSSNEKLEIKYYESEKDKVKINIQDGKLSLIGEYTKPNSIIKIRIKSYKVSTINIYLPKVFYDDVNIFLASGNISIKNFAFNNLKIETVSGNTTLENITVSNNMYLRFTSGNLNLKASQVSNDVTIKGVSGNFEVDTMVAKSIAVTTTSGNIELTNLTSDTIETRTTSGNIKVEIKGKKDDYRADLAITTGIITYDGLRVSTQVINSSKEKSLLAHAVSGKIKINFKD